MRTRTRRITADELLRMPDNGMRQELLAGEVRESPLPGFQHGRVAMEFMGRLGRFVGEEDLGAVYAGGTGFVLAKDPDTVRAPDGAFVSKSRLRGIPRDGYFPGAPDLALEVLSPDDTRADVHVKMADWLAAECRMVVVVDPRGRTVEVHRSGADVDVLSDDATFEGGDVLPGFRLPVGQLFED